MLLYRQGIYEAGFAQQPEGFGLDPGRFMRQEGGKIRNLFFPLILVFGQRTQFLIKIFFCHDPVSSVSEREQPVPVFGGRSTILIFLLCEINSLPDPENRNDPEYMAINRKTSFRE